ncbi:Vbh2 [Candidatus Rickettsiella viridis]|uniref:Type IV secretory systen protein VirB2 n=1 Tax=Candidatus Rickettsiella viridis TaxID=676208 RepID=A0A2Z5V2S6_9COXI|nr:TrbC/VirB2 family protein [Candidatus Rickettsiella viridis]BBB14772.1 type IV secretory systen protein VirB2 [Candidatus Rickettsiella viridis]BBB15502.1 Vbh2 [Candidatus Rickettsiella viridis]
MMADRFKKGNKIYQVLLRSPLIIFPFIFSSSVWAFGGDTPVSQGLNYVIDAVYGATGLSIATVAIIGMGLLCAGHYLEWKRFLQTLVGIAIMFGAGGVARALHLLIS